MRPASFKSSTWAGAGPAPAAKLAAPRAAGPRAREGRRVHRCEALRRVGTAVRELFVLGVGGYIQAVH